MPSWFQGEVKTTRRVMVPVELHWTCPEPGCGGEMMFTGPILPSMEPGYVHRCNKCCRSVALMGKCYPMMTHEPKGKK